jgi:4-aminobutyrate aminotransferase
LKLIETKYLRNAGERGVQLREGLEALRGRHPIVREVRGKGLMIGMEIQDEAGRPAPGTRDDIIDAAFHRGLLLLPCGPSTVRFCPPLCLTRRQVEIGLELLDAAMGDVREADQNAATVRASL